MSYPPPGPQDQRPQDRTHGYVPGSAAPDYGRPPRKNRAGLIITLLLVLLVAVLGVGGVVAYRLISDKTSSAPAPLRTSAAPASTPEPTVPPSQPPKTSRPSAGTTKGATVSGVVIIHDLDTEPLCVRVFNLTPS